MTKLPNVPIGQLNQSDPFLNDLLRASEVLTKQISIHSSWNCKMRCIDALLELQREYFQIRESEIVQGFNGEVIIV